MTPLIIQNNKILLVGNKLASSTACCCTTPAPTPTSCDTSVKVVNMAMVTVGDPFNLADTTTGYGKVDYSYKIAAFEVTGSQYTTFLNAVAKTDTYGLYNEDMQNNDRAAQISRSGSSPNYVYAVNNSTGNLPISYVKWWNCCRFANWMSNGQPSGAQNSTTTERGAYTIDGRTEGSPYVAASVINPNTGSVPTYQIPLENEWYKAAYYDPTKPGYWTYATQTDVEADATIGSTPSAIDVGTKKPSYYGTFDQSGNVWEWNEPISPLADANSIIFRGGRYFLHAGYLRKDNAVFPLSTGSPDSTIGFRLSSLSLCPTTPPPTRPLAPTPSLTPGVSPGLVPILSAVTPNENGLSTTITNYSRLYQWSAAVSQGTGTIVLGPAVGLVNVVGMSSGNTSTITVTSSRTGYSSASASVTGTAS